jgi:hypothetical protein
VHSTTGDVADFGIDLGKLVALAFPQIPPAFTLKVDKHFDHTEVQPVVQASGAQTRVCTWRVSDSEMAYEFQPSIVVATTPGEGLTLTAELHVEVRKRILGVFHKTYGKSARAQRYEMSYTEAGLVPKGWSEISEATREEAAMPPEKHRHLLELQRIYDQYNEGRGDG